MLFFVEADVVTTQTENSSQQTRAGDAHTKATAAAATANNDATAAFLQARHRLAMEAGVHIVAAWTGTPAPSSVTTASTATTITQQETTQKKRFSFLIQGNGKAQAHNAAAHAASKLDTHQSSSSSTSSTSSATMRKEQGAERVKAFMAACSAWLHWTGEPKHVKCLDAVAADIAAATPAATTEHGGDDRHTQKMDGGDQNKNNQTFDYPKARRGSTATTYRTGAATVTVQDPYRWLEDNKAPETKEWIDAQNAITMPYLESCPGRAALRERLAEINDYVKWGTPFLRGSAYFFFKNDGLQNQSVLYKQDRLDAGARVFFDPNKLSDDGTAALNFCSFSESGTYMAYGIARSGSDWVTIKVRDVASGNDLGDGSGLTEGCVDELHWVKFSSCEWLHDDSGFFYCRYPKPASMCTQSDDAHFQRGSETDEARNQAVYYHKIGTRQDEDVLIYRTPDEPKWMFSVDITHDGAYFLLSISRDCEPVNRLYFAPVSAILDFIAQQKEDGKSESKQNDNSGGKSDQDVPPSRYFEDFDKVVDDFEAQYSYICNDGFKFLFKTNEGAPRYKLLEMDLSVPGKARDVSTISIPEHEQDVLQCVKIVNQTVMVLCYMRHVCEILEVRELWSNRILLKELPLPAPGSIAALRGRRNDTQLFYKFVSQLHPGTIFRCDMSDPANIRTSVFREAVIQNFDASDFEVKQRFYSSYDGTRIPMFIMHRRDLKMDCNNPTLLYGYGGFSISLCPSFSISRLVFCQHFNGVVAVPNIRGGGEYGETWHQAGTKLNKQNVFDDFQAAAEYLIKERYTSPDKIAINGGSNGGLLVAACVNQRPELFGCGVAAVGVLDMLRFHLFTIGSAWCSDYGCADKDDDEFAALKAYSPVHNVAVQKAYPAVLLTTADHDDRVVPLHSFKYAAALQHHVGSKPYQVAPLMIRIECKAGHGAGKPLSKVMDEQADVLAFMARSLDVPLTFEYDL